MKLEVKRPVELTVTGIRVTVPVRYDEEDIPNDFPFRNGNTWSVVVDGSTGRIRDWPQGFAGECSMKVVDQGVYELLGTDDTVVAKIDQDYVPGCIPGSYGDYIEFDIGPDGAVKDWEDSWTAENIHASFFSDDK